MRQKRSERRKRRTGKIIAVLLLTITLGLLSTFYYVKAQMESVVYTEIFYPGIVVEGINLEGMSYAEAKAAVSDIIDKRLSEYGLVLRYMDETWHFDHTDLNLKANLDQVLDEAYNIGRQGALLARYDRINDLRNNPVEFRIELSMETAALLDKVHAVAKAINQDAVDASLSFDTNSKEMFTITKEKDGVQLDVDQLMKDIEAAFNESNYVELELEPQVVKPKVYEEDLAQQTRKLAVFYTVVTGTESRKHNVFLSARQFDGMVVNPGEIVSFNATTGQRSIENGYKAAPVIAADKSLIDDLGGGVCQTSSTIYNAILRAGLKIEERIHHSFPSTYVPKGHDATVNWPNVDFKFKNDKDTPIYIHTYRQGDRLYVEIYGKADSSFDEIRLESETYASYKAPEPNVVQDVNKKYVTYKDQKYTKVESRPGYKVRTYRVYFKDGQEVDRELISDDYYRPITGTVYVGVEDRPAKAE